MAPPRTLLAAALVAVLALAVAPAASFMRRPYVAFDENIEAPAGADVGEPLLISRVREASGAAFARCAGSGLLRPSARHGQREREGERGGKGEEKGMQKEGDKALLLSPPRCGG